MAQALQFYVFTSSCQYVYSALSHATLICASQSNLSLRLLLTPPPPPPPPLSLQLDNEYPVMLRATPGAATSASSPCHFLHLKLVKLRRYTSLHYFRHMSLFLQESPYTRPTPPNSPSLRE